MCARTKGLAAGFGVNFGDDGGEINEMIVGSLASFFEGVVLVLKTVTVGFDDESACLPLLLLLGDFAGLGCVGVGATVWPGMRSLSSPFGRAGHGWTRPPTLRC